jgi:ATP-dependent Clp protease ATP-binding subunit ClpB
MNKFDQVVTGALDIAQSTALQNKHTELSHWHLLSGLIQTKSSFAHRSLKEQTKEVEAQIQRLARAGGQVTIEQLRPSSKLSEWLTMASGHVAQRGGQEVAEKDLLYYLPKIFPELKVTLQNFKTPQRKSKCQVFSLTSMRWHPVVNLILSSVAPKRFVR